MKKQFLINILLLVLLNALIKPFWVFGIDRTVQNMLGHQVYGLYFALFNFAILFNTILDFGITNFNNKSIAQNPQLISSYFPRLIYTKLLLGVVYLLICLAMAIFLNYNKTALVLIGILALNQFLASILLFLRSNISGLQLYLADSILSVVDRFFMVVLCSALIWGKLVNVTFSIELFVLLQTFSYFLACFMALAIIYNHHGKFEFSGVPLFSRGLLFKSFPFALLGFLMAIHNRIDAVFLERISSSGAYEAGIYAQSFRIFDAIGMIAVLFAALLLPMFAKQFSKGEDPRPLVKMAFSMLFTSMVILVANLVGFAFPILNFLYVDLVPKAVSVFILLMLTLIPVSLNYIFGTLLTAHGNLMHLNRIAGITLIINIILNLVLIPMHGAVGAAISAFVSQLFACLVQIFLCRKIFAFHITLDQSKQYLVFIVVTILMVFIFSQIQVSFLTGLIFSGTFSITIALLFKMMNLREIVRLIRAE